ncbi:MAG: hypothetical protein KGZ79_11405 [Dethiobacter sp.]|jgi:hypothetical protein|nr:hypothetical protein [Dethiobacter sp.]
MMRILGVAGTAKNTGKTTTTISLINSIPDPAMLGITSIGYDGEAIDNVTGLPKPRLHIPEGALVVTAENCLPAGSASLQKLEMTDISTPLGRLVIGRVLRGGLVVLAGPNSENALRDIISRLKKYNLKLLLVDGALGRLAPMSAADGLIIATGASRNTCPTQLLQEALAIEYLLSLPVLPAVEPVFSLPSLLVESDTGLWPGAGGFIYKTVEFSGVVDIKPFLPIAESLELFSPLPGLVFHDPVKLLLCGDLEKMAAKLLHYNKKGGRVGVHSPLPLLAVTVNPFYPHYNKVNGHYGSAMLHADNLWQAFNSGLTVPVVDIVRQGGEKLAGIINSLINCSG